MQVGIFAGQVDSSLTVNSPAGIAGEYATGVATFGPTSFELTDDLVLVNDGQGTTTDGCEAMSGLSDLIAVIDRGTCTFPTKVTNAQNAGAVGVLVVDNQQSTNPPPLTGTAAGVTVPVLSLTLDDGNTIKGALAADPVTVTMRRTVLTDRDGAIDNQLVAHEWGHYLSNRLIGGGLTTNQSAGLGEGCASVSREPPGRTPSASQGAGAAGRSRLSSTACCCVPRTPRVTPPRRAAARLSASSADSGADA